MSAPVAKTELSKFPQLQEQDAPYPWIIHPLFDFLFVFGGAFWIVVAASYYFLHWTNPSAAPISDHAARILCVLVLLATNLSASPHNAATYMRSYANEADRKRFSFYNTWLVGFCIFIFF